VILRRVTEHVKSQNWFAVGVDLVIVVVGVFIGIQVANWNDSRRAAEQHQRYLERMATDFRSIRQRTDAHFGTFEKIIDGADYVLQLLRLPEEEYRGFTVDEQRLKDALANLDQLRIPPGRSATYMEMVSAGQLSALRNSALRDRLADYDRLAEIHLEVHRLTVALNTPQHPILFRHYKVATAFDPTALSGMSTEIVRFDLAAMRADPEFETAVMMMQTGARNAFGVRKFEARLVDEILGLLDAETRP
jgi:hypothetical protein